MTNPPRARLGLAAATFAVGVGACQWVGGIDDRAAYEESEPEAGPKDASGGVDAPDATPACVRAGLPPMPAASTSSAADAISGVFAVSALRLRSAADAGVGFDLDRACTCPQPDTCRRPTNDVGVSLAPACDDPGGIDNAARGVFDDLAAFKMLDEGSVNNALAHGAPTLLIRIDKYNGQPDDARVDVAVIVSTGYSDTPDASPRYDGTEGFLVDYGSFQNFNVAQPRYVTTSAYVSGGKLVATLDFPVPIGGLAATPIVATLRGGIIVATLGTDRDAGAGGFGPDVGDAGATVLDLRGTLAGRWNAGELLTGLQALVDPLAPSQHLCSGSATFDAIQRNLCSHVDIATSPVSDKGGTCDALSIAIGFDARRAQIGQPRTLTTWPYCGAAYTARCP